MIRILPVRITGLDWSPKKTKCPSSTSINKGGFQALGIKKSEAKVKKKNHIFSLFFFSPLGHLFSLFLHRAFSVIDTTSHTPNFHAPLGMPPTSLLLRLDKLSSHFSYLNFYRSHPACKWKNATNMGRARPIPAQPPSKKRRGKDVVKWSAPKFSIIFILVFDLQFVHLNS